MGRLVPIHPSHNPLAIPNLTPLRLYMNDLISVAMEIAIVITATHNATAQDGFYGTVQEWRKKLTAGIIHTLVDSTPVDQRK